MTIFGIPDAPEDHMPLLTYGKVQTPVGLVGRISGRYTVYRLSRFRLMEPSTEVLEIAAATAPEAKQRSANGS